MSKIPALLLTLEQKTGPLTHNQKVMITAHKEKLLGVARPLGQSKMFPAVLFGKNQINIIDACGHFQIAAPMSCKLLEDL